MVQQGKLFTDRRDAGIELGKLLQAEYKDRNVLVIGIPRGGVEVAFHVAEILNGQLTLVVAQKLPHPHHPDLALGAVAEDGSVYFSSLAGSIGEPVLQDIIRNQIQDIKRNIRRFRHGKPLPLMEGRIVMIVDDGIATGATIVPVLKLCKAKNAAKIIVAAPVSGDNYVSDIAWLADEIKILEQPDDFFAVGQVYEDFHQPSDDEIASLMESFEKRVSKY